MMKKILCVVIPVAFIVLGVCIAMQKDRIPPEKIPPLNNFDTADMIIALVVDGSEVYQFILSSGNELEISCGYMQPYYGSDNIGGVVQAREDDFIKSIDFMRTVEIKRSTIIPEEVYDKMTSLGNQIIDEKPGKLLHGAGETNIAVFRPDARYEMNYLFNPATIEGELVDMLEEYSPIVIRYRITYGKFEEKGLEN